MKTYRMRAQGVLAGLSLVATCASPATSAEINASGTLTFVRTQFERISLGGDKLLNETHIKGVLLASDPSPPPHLASQDCDFAISVDDKGMPAQGYGYCATIDKEGDVYWIWLSIMGPADSKWAVVSGTGKYAGMTGAGMTKVLMATADGRLTLALSGTLNMK